jgi:hypothetical protein
MPHAKAENQPTATSMFSNGVMAVSCVKSGLQRADRTRYVSTSPLPGIRL